MREASNTLAALAAIEYDSAKRLLRCFTTTQAGAKRLPILIGRQQRPQTSETRSDL